MKISIPSFLWVLAIIATPFSSLHAEEFKPSLKIGGLVFSTYSYQLSETPGAHNNQFSIDRVYLNFKAKMTEDFAARVTTDVGYVKNSDDQKMRAFLKYAYVEYKGLAEGMKLRFGAAGTAFIGKHDSFVGQRWISKAFSDQSKVLSSSDMGLHILGSHADGMLGYQFSVINGGGYGKKETNDGKAAQLQITADPMSGGDMEMPISAFISEDIGMGNDTAGEAIVGTRVLGGALGFKNKLGLLWAEYIMKDDGEVQGAGYSATLIPKITDHDSLYARIDNLDPDTETDGDSTMRLLAGVTHHYSKKISCGIIYERTMPEEGDAAHGVMVKAQAGF